MVEYRFPRPAFTADVVAFASVDGVLSVLVIRRGNEPFAGRWALPGGFVDEGERPEDAARRELAEETGLRFEGPLDLVGVYGDPGRDPRGWTVSAAYRAVLERPAEVAGADDAAEARWFALDALPSLAFDHDHIVADAVSPDIERRA
ncbi:MAG: NUDIX hydrolase [Coriobacteriia bacterium]|nr:NUDIX hydrolase [Coriobacteriia bacterium]MBN2839705.1 NUDIX hydrolase [Coriobacteriia bacterium]